MPGTDAIFQDSEMLRSRFGGKELILYPFLYPSSYLPRFFYGWHKLLILNRLQKEVSINHVFSPGLYDFPVLRLLKKPVVYSITATLRDQDLGSKMEKFFLLDQIIVNNERDWQKLKDKGFENTALVPPMVNLSGLKPHCLPLENHFNLLMASAPWERDQFDSKGVNLLLKTIKANPRLRLILLWRGRLFKELIARIKNEQVESQVEVIDRKVNIRDMMARVHATVLVSNSSEVVKSYPNSLLESLACAKPVILSGKIAMSDFVRQKGCGMVLEEFRVESLLELIGQLENNYDAIRKAAEFVDLGQFSSEHVLSLMSAIYHQINPMS